MSAVRPPASALSHKRTLSSLNRPSPAGQSPLASGASPATAGGPGSVAADSPERSAKRARFDAPAAKASPAASATVPSPSPGQGPSRNGQLAEDQKPLGGKSTLSKGAEWIIKQVEVMEAQYKEAILAAVLIMRNRSYTIQLGLKPGRTPLHLLRAFRDAWSAYEATRRHIEHYMQQSALQASTPSRPVQLPQQPTPVPSQLTPLPTAPMGASPVPLASSSIMGFDTDDPAKLAQLVNGPPPITGLEGINFGAEMGADGQGVPGTGTDQTGGEGMDFGDLGMAELSAIISGEGYDFGGGSTVPPPSMGSAATRLVPAGTTGMDISGDKGGATGGGSAMTPNTAAETERILAQFSSGMPDGNGAPAGTEQQIDGGANAAAGGGAEDMLDFSSFDFSQMASMATMGMGNTGDGGEGAEAQTGGMSDMDLGNLSELAGLFGSDGPSQVATAAASPSQTQPPAPATAADAAAAGGSNAAHSSAAPQGPTGSESKQAEPAQSSQTQSSQATGEVQQMQQQQQDAAPLDGNDSSAPAVQQASMPPNQAAGMVQHATVNQPPLPATNLAVDTSGSFDALGLGNFGQFQVDGGMGGEMEGINMDDFDFGDSSLPNVEGDEFESLFAEFK